MADWPYNTAEWRTARSAALRRDGRQCLIRMHCCLGVADTVDHIVPLAKGGAPFELSNLRSACRPCNGAMAARGDPVVKPSRVW